MERPYLVQVFGADEASEGDFSVPLGEKRISARGADLAAREFTRKYFPGHKVKGIPSDASGFLFDIGDNLVVMVTTQGYLDADKHFSPGYYLGDIAQERKKRVWQEGLT